MSLRDKFKNKVKGTNSKVEPEKMESFDQNSIVITVIEGKSQLSQIKLICKWANPSITFKLPQLKCTWYNKTENNIETIVGVQTPHYQPSLADVQTFINVQCVPSLQGVEYEGMPLMKVIGPIMLDPETDQQAKDLLQAQKATFFIQYKQFSIQNLQQTKGVEGLIKIIKNQLVLFAKKSLVTGNIQIFSTDISASYPQFIINRKNSKQLNVILNQKNDYATIAFGNNKLRDVFCLLTKLIVSKSIIEVQEKKQEKQEKQPQILVSQVQNSPQSQEKNQKKQETTTTLSEVKSQQTLAISSKPKTQQNLQSPKKNSQTPLSPKLPTIQKIPSSPGTPSTKEILQFSDLKQKITKLQAENSKLKKQLQTQKQTNQSLTNKIDQNKQRAANFDKNYKQLQKQVLRLKQLQGKGQQQLSYLRNQERILKSNNLGLIKQNENLKEKLTLVETMLKKYRSNKSSGQGQVQLQKQTYEQLQKKLNEKSELCKELQMKYNQARSERTSIQEQLNKYRVQMEELECQKKYLQRKYESLSSQITSSPSKSRISNISKNERQKSIQLKSISEDDHKFNNGVSECRQQQILQIKKQLKQVIDQNNYLKTLSIKQKKSSSKTQLKLELLELKKLANRLAQSLTQKQSALQNCKNINKQLNMKIIEMNKITMQQMNSNSINKLNNNE